jgi:hypothetical protein
MNVTPEEELEKRLKPLLRRGFKIISAQTSIALHGNIERFDEPGALFFDIAKHAYYVTTVVLEKT